MEREGLWLRLRHKVCDPTEFARRCPVRRVGAAVLKNSGDLPDELGNSTGIS